MANNPTAGGDGSGLLGPSGRATGEAIQALEDESFVGREQELAFFEDWLAREVIAPEILNLSGHGGVGKSALLRAFARIARRMGRPALLLDSRDFPHTPQGLLGALGGSDLADVLSRLNLSRPLLLFDTF